MKMKKLIALITMTALLGASSIVAYAEGNVDCENGKHEPNLEFMQEADYHDCTGGFKVDYYPCIECHVVIDIDGNVLENFDPVSLHVPGVEAQMEWSTCNGGYPDPCFICEDCGYLVLEDGTNAFYVEGDGKHNPDLDGECREANYIPCDGGYKEDRYRCLDCGNFVFANGEEAVRTEGDGKHTPDLENVLEPNYIPCYGGYKVERYVCIYEECGTYVNAEGEELEFIEAEAPHPLEYVAKVEPTVEKEGCKEHWKCTACGELFADAEGTEWVFDFELVIDKLDKVEDDSDVEEPTPEDPTDKPTDEKPTPEDSTDKPEKEESDTVKTGDSANVMGYLTATLAALVVMVSVLLKRKNA